MGDIDQKRLKAAVKKLRSNKKPSLHHILSFAWTTLQACGQGKTLCKSVDKGRDALAKLQPGELAGYHVPEASHELDVATAAMEQAADRIMASAEAVLADEKSKPAAYRSAVNAAMLEIIEACSFQDISGQHIAKADELLARIGTRLEKFAPISDIREAQGAATKCEAKRIERAEELILHGPAKDGDGLGQDDIDALLAG